MIKSRRTTTGDGERERKKTRWTRTRRRNRWLSANAHKCRSKKKKNKRWWWCIWLIIRWFAVSVLGFQLLWLNGSEDVWRSLRDYQEADWRWSVNHLMRKKIENINWYADSVVTNFEGESAHGKVTHLVRKLTFEVEITPNHTKEYFIQTMIIIAHYLSNLWTIIEQSLNDHWALSQQSFHNLCTISAN